MKCLEIVILFGGYLEGLLNDNEEKLVEDHLKQCTKCYSEFIRFKEFYKSDSFQQELKAIDDLPAKVMKRIQVESKQEQNEILFSKFRKISIFAIAASIIISVYFLFNISKSQVKNNLRSFFSDIPNASAAAPINTVLLPIPIVSFDSSDLNLIIPIPKPIYPKSKFRIPESSEPLDNYQSMNIIVGKNKNDIFIQSELSLVVKNIIIGYKEGISGIYELRSGNLYVYPLANQNKPLVILPKDKNYSEYIGFNGKGLFEQTGYLNATHELSLGHNPSSSGKYILSSGELYSTYEVIGRHGIGNFIQTIIDIKKPSINNSYRIFLGYEKDSKGKYELLNGNLESDELSIGVSGKGQFIQQHGTNRISHSLILANNPSSEGAYILNDGNLYSYITRIGDQGAGIFSQNGGYLKGKYTVVGNSNTQKGLFIQKGGINETEYLIMSNSKNSKGYYRLEGGELRTNYTFLSYADKSIFINTGGTHIVNSDLYITQFQADTETKNDFSKTIPSLPPIKESEGAYLYYSNYNLIKGLLDVKGDIKAGQGFSTIIIDGGILNVGRTISGLNNFYIGFKNNGKHVQNSTYYLNNLYLGFNRYSYGEYEIKQNASLITNDQRYNRFNSMMGYDTGVIYIGYNGTGKIILDGGIVQTSALFVGSNFGSVGEYVINTGRHITSFESASASSGTTYVGYNGSQGTIKQFGGTFESNSLYIGIPAFTRGWHNSSSPNEKPIFTPWKSNLVNGISKKAIDFSQGFIISDNNPTGGLKSASASMWYYRCPTETLFFTLMSFAWWYYSVGSGWGPSFLPPQDTDIKTYFGIMTKSLPPDVPLTYDMPIGKWIHSAIIIDKGVLKEYIAGKLTFQKKVGEQSLGTGYKFILGTLPQIIKYNYTFQGRMDEFLIYDRALTENEIQLLSNKETYKNDFFNYAKNNSLKNGVILYYPFDEVKDKSIFRDKSYLFRNPSDIKKGKYELSGNNQTFFKVNELYIGNWGEFIYSGGIFNVNRMVVGDSEGGKFEISLSPGSSNVISTNINILEEFRLENNCTFIAKSKCAINMKNGSFVNKNDNPSQLSDLRNLTLIFYESHNKFDVKGKDNGASINGFNNNYAIDAIILTENSKLSLNKYTNEKKALYVNKLVIRNNSYLHLNGINIYYKEIELKNKNGIVYEGGSIQKI